DSSSSFEASQRALRKERACPATGGKAAAGRPDPTLRGQRIGRPKQLKLPVLVKPVKEEASYGISQASFVQNDEQFRERVAFIHEKHESDVIAEEYIDGRELYVSLMGNARLTVFPIRELVFREVPPNEPKIATYSAKWDEEYRKRWGLENQFPEALDPARVAQVDETCQR